MTVDGALTFARRWAIVAMLSFVVLWGVWLYRLCAIVSETRGDPARITWFTDHMAFYTGAQLTRFGGEDKLYDYVFTSAYQNHMFDKDPVDTKKDVWTWLLAFRNPPFYAMLYWPTCDWPYMESALFWTVASMLLTMVSVWWLTDDGRYWRRFGWVLSFLPVNAAFDYGQNTPLSFFLFSAVYVLMTKKRWFLAGLVAGLLLYKPQLLLGLGVWALFDFRRKWPSGLGVLITGCILAAISFTVLPTATEKFRDSFKKNLKFDSFEHHKMHNPLAMIRLLLPAEKIAKELYGPKPDASEEREPDHPYYTCERRVRFLHNAFTLTCALAAIALFGKLYKHRGDDMNVMFGGVIFLTLWANPHTLIYEWMLLAITGLLWVREWGSRPNTWFALYAAAWGVLYFSTDVNGWILNYSPITLQWSVPVLAVVGWYAVNLLTKPPTEPQLT